MNRQEIIEQLKIIQAGLTQDDNNKSKNRIDAVIENLKQPITLADFLGWEEDVIYVDKDTNIMYKIQDDNLLEIIGQSLTIDSSYCFSKFSIEELRQFKKIQYKKYNLILQKGYRKLFDLLDCEKYLTMDIDEETIFNSKYSNDNSKYQVRFTLEEIENIKKRFKINLSIYDVVEVRE